MSEEAMLQRIRDAGIGERYVHQKLSEHKQGQALSKLFLEHAPELPADMWCIVVEGSRGTAYDMTMLLARTMVINGAGLELHTLAQLAWMCGNEPEQYREAMESRAVLCIPRFLDDSGKPTGNPLRRTDQLEIEDLLHYRLDNKLPMILHCSGKTPAAWWGLSLCNRLLEEGMRVSMP